MTKYKIPSGDELAIALDAAKRMRHSDVDPHHMAESLLYLAERQKDLEKLLLQADRFLRFGMEDRELSSMRRTVEKLQADAISRNENLDLLPI